jgi:beta-N-acetylhexosaminidase
MMFFRSLLVRTPRVLLAAALLWAAGCSRGEREPGWAERTLPRLSLRERVAQMVAVPVRGDPASLARVRRWVREDSVGGVWVERGSALPLRNGLAALQETSPLPLLVVAELDGGAPAPEATPFSPARVVAAAGDAPLARRVAAQAAREARALGIHVGVVSLPPIEADPAATLPLPMPPAEVLEEYLEGLREGGVRPGVRALHAEGGAPPVLRWDRARLEAVELRLLREAVEEDAAAVVLPALSLPALTGDSTPLALSPAAHRLLRRDLGFRGVVAADLRPGSPLVRRLGEREAAVRAVAAGADLLLGISDPSRVIDAVVAAAGAGRISPARIEAAARRVLEAKERAGRAEARPPPDTLRLRAPEAREASREAAARTRVVLGRPAALLRACRAPLLLAPPWTRPLQRELVTRLPALRVAEVAGDSLPSPVAALARGADCLAAADSTPAGGAALLEAARRPAAAAPADTAARDSTPKRTLLLLPLSSTPSSPPRADAAVLAWGTDPEAQRLAARAAAAEVEGVVRPPWPPARTLRTVEPAAVGMSEEGLARADQAIREAIREGVFPGAALAVGRRGGLVRLRGYGTLSGGPREVDARETLYDIASLSKVAGTTAAVMGLVEDGKLRLDAPVRRYLPEFRGKWKGDVTVRHLLTHTAGLPAGDWLYGSARSPEVALRQALEVRLLRPPGERMVYSDFGFILLGEIAARAAEEPLDRYLARRVYAPLGMQSTQYLPPRLLLTETAPTAPRSEREYVLRGVVHDANAFRLGGVAGHAGLFSTAADLAVFSQALLNGGSYGTRRVYSPETVRRFAAAQGVAGRRGLGWDKPARGRSAAGSYLSPATFGHTGFTGTSLWIDPERDLFVVFLANRTFSEATSREMLAVRERVHDAVARAITDATVRPRPGTPAALEEERQARIRAERARKAKKGKARPGRRPRRRG